MRTKSLIILAGTLLVTLCLACSTCPTQIHIEQLMKRAPTISGQWYHCEDMVSVVNSLRRCGKVKALEFLRKHVRKNGPTGDPREEKKVFLICRLLFVNPNGWDRLKLGRPIPEVNGSVADEFPLFPIAVSDGVPFLLIEGYAAGGFGESAEACLKICKDLSLIPADLSKDNYTKAGEALVRSEAFQHLFTKTEDTEQMAEMILLQAERSASTLRSRPATEDGRSGCNPRVPWAGSLSLGR